MDKAQQWQHSQQINALDKSRNPGTSKMEHFVKKSRESSHLKANSKTLPHYFNPTTSDISPNTNITFFSYHTNITYCYMSLISNPDTAFQFFMTYQPTLVEC